MSFSSSPSIHCTNTESSGFVKGCRSAESQLEFKVAFASEAITWFVVLSGEDGSWFKSFLILIFLTETQVK